MTLFKYILNQKFSIHEFINYQESYRLTSFFVNNVENLKKKIFFCFFIIFKHNYLKFHIKTKHLKLKYIFFVLVLNYIII